MSVTQRSQSFLPAHAWPTGTRQTFDTELQLFVLQSLSMVHGPPTSLLGPQPLPAMHRSELGQPHTSQRDGSACEHGTSIPPLQTYSPVSSLVHEGRHFLLPSGAVPQPPPAGHVPLHGCEHAPYELVVLRLRHKPDWHSESALQLS
jgi:hypothetical protein